jgi:hypothetical protein
MALADQFRAIERNLPTDWNVARLRLIVSDEGDCARAAALLGPTNPGRHGKVIHFLGARRGAGIGADRIRALLGRLDDERIEGSLELAGVEEAAAAGTLASTTLASAWDAATAALPPDWSDVIAEVEVTSSDYIEPGALRLSPVNPTRVGDRPAFRFRVARTLGYGASPEMARRCLERLDEGGIRGSVRIVDAFSDADPVRTQGLVWTTGGRIR